MNTDRIQFPDGYPELLEQIGQVIFRRLRRHDIAHQSAIDMTLGLVEDIRAEIGGSQQYIPRGLSFELAQRDREIWAKFTGNNYDTLAREYRLTEMQVRNIIKRARQRNMVAQQGALPDAQN